MVKISDDVFYGQNHMPTMGQWLSGPVGGVVCSLGLGFGVARVLPVGKTVPDQ